VRKSPAQQCEGRSFNLPACPRTALIWLQQMRHESPKMWAMSETAVGIVARPIGYTRLIGLTGLLHIAKTRKSLCPPRE
jgi:hypothetical protein